MSDRYIPFDFGSWTLPAGRECVHHGKQYGGPLFAITPAADEPTHIREYCGMCLLAALDNALPPLVTSGDLFHEK